MRPGEAGHVAAWLVATFFVAACGDQGDPVTGTSNSVPDDGAIQETERTGCEWPGNGGASDFRRTVILVEAQLAPWQHLFVRGGARDASSRRWARVPRGIPIRHRNLLDPFTRAWKQGDTLLDWLPRQPGQTGVIYGMHAMGTPADWTTDEWDPGWGPERSVERDGYGVEPLNRYGPSYYMVDVDMDCAAARQGSDGTRWFEFTAFVSPGRGGEGWVSQPDAPYPSWNHFGKCGAITVVRRGHDEAIYASFEPPPPDLELSPLLAWCPPGSTCAGEEGLGTSCPQEGVPCTGGERSTLVTWTINGRPFDAFLLTVDPPQGGAPVVLVPGAANTTSLGSYLIVRGASGARIVEGRGASIGSFSYYGVAPVWGGVTSLDFRGATLQTGHGHATFVRHASFDLGFPDEQLVAMVDEVYADEAALAGRDTPAYHAFFSPSELSVLGDGNFAIPPDTAIVNYGNPGWLDSIGGFQVSMQWEWAHELSHLLFSPEWNRFQDASCLSEGLADATANFLGYMPDSDQNWASNSLDSTCRGLSMPHARGNCYLWHLKHYGASDAEAGRYWTRSTLTALYTPLRTLELSTCSMPEPSQAEPTPADVRNGDGWVVYFSDATGEDMTAFVESLGFFTSGSLAASLEALGFQDRAGSAPEAATAAPSRTACRGRIADRPTSGTVSSPHTY